MPTQPLFHTDPLLLQFRARAIVQTPKGERSSLVLDRTAFYPEGGGQLPDLGVLRAGAVSSRVLDVQIDDDGTIHHLLDRPLDDVAPGVEIEGLVDEARRRDHMSQHTGQHMLSRALLDVARAETVSSRLGAGASTIDLGVPGLADASLASAEDRVNDLVLEGRPVRALFPTREELAAMPLRRVPKVERDIRIIAIEGFDLTPCGGTHCTQTGQVGPVRITGVERYKGMLRVTFVAGARALGDYRSKHAALGELSRSLSCGPLDVPQAVEKLRADLRARGALLGQVRGELTALLAARLLAESPPDPSGTTRVVSLRQDDNLPALRALAAAIARRADAVAFAASRDPDSGDWLVVVERGASASFDCGKWLKALVSANGGKGGGRPERAEGRLSGASDWERLARAT